MTIVQKGGNNAFSLQEYSFASHFNIQGFAKNKFNYMLQGCLYSL